MSATTAAEADARRAFMSAAWDALNARQHGEASPQYRAAAARKDELKAAWVAALKVAT